MAAKKLPERRDEALDDALRRLREGVKLSNARLSSPRAVTRKDYLRGVGYVGWKEFFLQPGGKRYEATFAVRRLEGAFDEEFSISKRDARVLHCLGGEHDLVLVRYIEAVDSIEGPIPSAMWLGLSHEACGFLTGAWAGQLLSDRLLEFREVANDREVATCGISAVGNRTSGDEVIERRSKIVNGVSNDEGNLGRERSPHPNLVSVKLRHWVNFGPGEVQMAVHKFVSGALESSGVAFRALKL